MRSPIRRLVLLGDSILDNAPYTHPEPDTSTHLARALGSAWRVERLAEDGAIIRDVKDQLDRLQGHADVAVLSMGGNDAVAHLGLLDRSAEGSAEVLDELVTIGDEFASAYEDVARAVTRRAGRTLLCTIYEVPLEPSAYARRVRAPLGVLNDRIVRTAMSIGADVLELRTVCTHPEDFVLQIEPSARGALRIARAIAASVQEARSPTPTRVHGAPR